MSEKTAKQPLDAFTKGLIAVGIAVVAIAAIVLGLQYIGYDYKSILPASNPVPVIGPTAVQQEDPKWYSIKMTLNNQTEAQVKIPGPIVVDLIVPTGSKYLDGATLGSKVEHSSPVARYRIMGDYGRYLNKDRVVDEYQFATGDPSSFAVGFPITWQNDQHDYAGVEISGNGTNYFHGTYLVDGKEFYPNFSLEYEPTPPGN